jgi:hypothetical protein
MAGVSAATRACCGCVGWAEGVVDPESGRVFGVGFPAETGAILVCATAAFGSFTRDSTRIARVADFGCVVGLGGNTVVGFFFSFGNSGMVMLVWQEGQLILRPDHSVFTRMCWPQVGQLNLNSFIYRDRSIVDVQTSTSNHASGHGVQDYHQSVRSLAEAWEYHFHSQPCDVARVVECAMRPTSGLQMRQGERPLHTAWVDAFQSRKLVLEVQMIRKLARDWNLMPRAIGLELFKVEITPGAKPIWFAPNPF